MFLRLNSISNIWMDKKMSWSRVRGEGNVVFDEDVCEQSRSNEASMMISFIFYHCYLLDFSACASQVMWQKGNLHATT